MPEGIAVAGSAVSDGVHDDPERQPDPGPAAPRGWVWNRKGRHWKPRERGPVLWKPDRAQAADPASPPAHQQHDADPDPGWMQDGQPLPGDRKRQSIDDVPKEVVNDMAGLAGLVGAPVLALLQQADPYCGSILAANYEAIVDAVLPLVCRSEKIVRYFSGDQSDWLLWGKLAMALAPVGRAIFEHHVIGSVEVVRDPQTGAAQVRRRQQGGAEHGDHLVPPVPGEPAADFAYAA